MKPAPLRISRPCLSPAAEPFLEQMAEKAQSRNKQAFWKYRLSCLRRFILQTIVKTIVFIVDLTAITTSTA